MNGQGLEDLQYKLCEFLVLPKYLEAAALYLLNYAKFTHEKFFEWDENKYMHNRERIWTTLKLIGDNIEKVSDKK